MLRNSAMGLRIARLRSLAGLTQQQLADAIGRTRGLVGHIENGRVVPSSAILEQIASALGTTAAQLHSAGSSVDVSVEQPVHELVPQVRAALDGVLPRSNRDIENSRLLTVELHVARMACDYPRMSNLLPALLSDGVHGIQHGEPRAADVLVRACVAGAIMLRPIGYHDLSVRLAENAISSAREAEDPVLLSAAEFVLAQAAFSSGLESQRQRSLRMALAAAERLDGADGDDAIVWYGMSHLQAALAKASLGGVAEAEEHLAEAWAAASRSPRDTWVQEFSCPNVGVWRLAVYLQAGDREAAYVAARTADRTGLRTRHRRARFALDAARAYQGVGQTDRAITALLQAMELSPAEVRSRPATRELASLIVMSGHPDSRLPNLLSKLPGADSKFVSVHD